MDTLIKQACYLLSGCPLLGFFLSSREMYVWRPSFICTVSSCSDNHLSVGPTVLLGMVLCTDIHRSINVLSRSLQFRLYHGC